MGRNKGDRKMNELIKKLEQLERASRECADEGCNKYEEGRADAYREVITMLEENNASK